MKTQRKHLNADWAARFKEVNDAEQLGSICLDLNAPAMGKHIPQKQNNRRNTKQHKAPLDKKILE